MLAQLPMINDPLLPPKELKLVSKIVNPALDGDPVSVFVYRNHLVVLTESIHKNSKTGQKKHLFSQREYPVETARWFIDSIENDFIKGPKEGGMPQGEFSNDIWLAGENIYLLRGASIGGPSMPGYKLINLSRRNHKLQDTNQSFMMGDDFLFKYGLFDLWKDIAERHERGEF